jgi:hypothetical protein
VAGAIAILVVLTLIPIVVCLSSAIIAAVLAWLLNRDAELRYEGSELLELNN